MKIFLYLFKQKRFFFSVKGGILVRGCTGPRRAALLSHTCVAGHADKTSGCLTVCHRAECAIRVKMMVPRNVEES